MKNRIYSLLCILFLFSLCSCTSWYSYAGKRYDTKDEALQAQKNSNSNLVKNIDKNAESKFKDALLVLPSREAIMQRGLSGNTDQPSYIIDYLVTSVEASGNCMADVLRRSNLFEKIIVQKALYPGAVAYENIGKHEAIIYMKLPGSGKYRVMLVTPKSTKENLIFLDNKIPIKLSGFQFFLQNIEKTVQEDTTNTTPMSVTVKNQMMNEQTTTKGDDNYEQETLIGDEYNVGKKQKDQSARYFVSFNPFSYPNLHSSELGQNETVAILNLPDRRQDAKENDTHIGTVYGMVYHNPLVEIHSAHGVSQNAMDAMATLFTANGFRVKKYPEMHSVSAKNKARFIVTGQVNKLWTKCFHSAEAEVDFDIKIYDTKLNKVIWSGKIENYELEDPEKIPGLTVFLNRILGDAINKAWNKKLMRASFDSLSKEAATRQKVQSFEKVVKKSPMNAKDLVMLGIGYFDMKKYKDSITALKKSIRVIIRLDFVTI